MKKFKTLLIMALCFAFIVTTTTVAPNYDTNPCGHHTNNGDTI